MDEHAGGTARGRGRSGARARRAARVIRGVATALVLAVAPAAAAKDASPDAAFREGWSLLADEKFAEARTRFERIDPGSFDLGDYVLHFRGACLAGEGNLPGASAALEELRKAYPDSPLVPYLAHELAYAAVKEDDLAAAGRYFEMSRGSVFGNGRRAAAGYIAARLLEYDNVASRPPEAAEEPATPPAAAAWAHVDNFAAHTVQDGGIRSMERIWKWKSDGSLDRLGLPAAFFGKLAKALAMAGENDRARAVYREVIRKYPPAEEYFTVLLDYAEFLRKQWDTREARALLAKHAESAPPAFKSELDFLFARVEWKAGRSTNARGKFLEIADAGVRPGVAERARYQAAWIAEEDGDFEAAAAEFGRLRSAQDESIRQEATFRHAFGLYRLKRYPEAVAAFEKGEKDGFSSVERARHAYWKARALSESGETERAGAAMRTLASDPAAGPFTLFAIRSLGRDPFELLNAESAGATNACGGDKERLWETIRKADWTAADADKVRRAERLIALGVVDYAVLEAERIDRVNVRKAIGLVEGGTPALFRYLAGDLRGAIRETNGLSPDASSAGVIDRIQFPLAPEYVGDCDRKISGVDPLVLHSIIRQESQFQANALSPAGAVGLMQVMPGTAAEVARKEKKRRPARKDLLRPERNVAIGAAYLARLLRSYGGDFVRAVAAYNAGDPAVARWWEGADGDPALFLERMTYRETRFYVRRVFFNLLQYYRIYRPEMLARYLSTAPGGGPPAPGASGIPPGAGSPGALPAGPGSPAAATPGG